MIHCYLSVTNWYVSSLIYAKTEPKKGQNTMINNRREPQACAQVVEIRHTNNFLRLSFIWIIYRNKFPSPPAPINYLLCRSWIESLADATLFTID